MMTASAVKTVAAAAAVALTTAVAVLDRSRTTTMRIRMTRPDRTIVDADVERSIAVVRRRRRPLQPLLQTPFYCCNNRMNAD